MNYKTCTLEELIAYIDSGCQKSAIALADSPKSLAWGLSNHIGFFQGICYMRDFNYEFCETVYKWQNMDKLK